MKDKDERMTCLRKYKTELPVNVLIDENGAYRLTGENEKFVLFQLNGKDKSIDQPMGTMYLSGELKDDLCYDKDEIEKVRNFVINNSYAIEKVADQDLFMDQFEKVLIKGGKIVSRSRIDIFKQETDWFVKENYENYFT